MPRKKKIPRNDLGIPEYEMESLARILLPIMQEYLASEEGKRDYAEWKTRKKQGAVSTEKRVSNQENKLDEIEE